MLYAGSLSDKGYSTKYVKKDGVWKRAYLHREIYINHHGDIPNGMVIDHLCRNRSCINIDHLEAVTNRENLKRGNGASPYGEYCNKGHSLKDVGVAYRTKDSRYCIQCRRDTQKIWRDNNMDKVIANRERFKANMKNRKIVATN